MNEKLIAFRDAALSEGIPADIVDQLVSTARPCVTLGPHIDGPLAGVFGGHPPVPDGIAVPELPFVASIDLSLVPADATGLPLPESGVLLFFGNDNGRCEVLVLAPGQATTERTIPGVTVHPRRDLRLSVDMSIDCESVEFDEEEDPEGEWYDVLDEVSGVLSGGGTVRLGGHPPYHNYHPAAPVPGGVVLLSWIDGAGDLKGLDQGIVHWVIPFDDLTAGRFDRIVGSWDMI